jgi:hypothetical protein
MGRLTDLQIKNAEHREKEYFLADGDGLYLRVRPTCKVWLYRDTDTVLNTSPSRSST